MKIFHAIVSFVLILLLFPDCKQNFEPPAIQQRLGALVVDGFIHVGADTSVILLSRTKRLDEEKNNLPEKGASLSIEDEEGNTLYDFQELNDSGKYIVPGVNLDFNSKCRLKIRTTNGREYISDNIPVIKTPAIDSISWRKEARGFFIYANTHDPADNTHYYRWDYSETWQYRANFFSTLIYENGLRDRFPQEYIYECWRTNASTELLLASSVKLSQDIIHEKSVRVIPLNGIELSIKYFIFLKQYALTREHYEYLENLKRITEQTGSIFDAQPSEIKGNIHAVDNKNEVVIGYVSASSVAEKKLYIKNEEVKPWTFIQPCKEVKVPSASIDNYFRSGALIPLYYDGAGPAQVVLATERICADCTIRGGVTTRPDFWQ